MRNVRRIRNSGGSVSFQMVLKTIVFLWPLERDNVGLSVCLSVSVIKIIHYCNLISRPAVHMGATGVAVK